MVKEKLCRTNGGTYPSSSFQSELFSVWSASGWVSKFMALLCIIQEMVWLSTHLIKQNDVPNHHEMLKKLWGHWLIVRVFFRQLQSNFQHIKTVHSHPTCPIWLAQRAIYWQSSRSIKAGNIVETKETAFRVYHDFSIFFLDTCWPYRIKQVKYLQKR